MTSPLRTFSPLLVAIAVLLAPCAASAEEPDDPILAMSATFGGKASFAGLELEVILSPHVRVGLGAGIAMTTPTISGHVGWYPMGGDKSGVYVDAGVDYITFPECCGGPEVGGSAENPMLLPDLGIGWVYQGDSLLFKAGVDFVWFLDSQVPLLPIPIPGIRVGFQI